VIVHPSRHAVKRSLGPGREAIETRISGSLLLGRAMLRALGRSQGSNSIVCGPNRHVARLDERGIVVLLLLVILQKEVAMRVTQKGQVTIPLAIRERVGILPDTEVEFSVRGDTVILRKASRGGRRGGRLVQTMRGRATAGLTTDEIMALTRKR
jgi:AbrB family looped-hinge helix DNA binding protein